MDGGGGRQLILASREDSQNDLWVLMWTNNMIMIVDVIVGCQSSHS